MNHTTWRDVLPQSTETAGNPSTPATPAKLLDLLQADSIEGVASALLGALPACGRARMTWSAEWPRHLRSWPAGATEEGSVRHTLCDDGEGAVAMLEGPPEWLDSVPPPLLDAAARRLRELLGAHRLRESLERLGRAERLQHALFAIADMAGSGRDMPSLLQGLHGIIGGLMYADNFYIALYARERQTLRFIYFADVFNAEDYSSEEEIPLARLEGGLTWYVIRDCKPLMGSLDSIRHQVSGPLLARGADATDWLGVPMLRDDQIHGALVVQSYRDDVPRYTESDQALLSFVAEHVLTALERKQAQAELEQRVAERTRQLATANEDLHQQVRERLRGEHLQATLYRIAALANIDDDSERFYRQIHQAVGELINAENFYIALLSMDGTMLEFPYSVDAKDQQRPPRPLGRGLSEYVIRSGKSVLADRALERQLTESGEIVPGKTAPALCWLGVPLLDQDRVIGVVAVQSYRPDLEYDAGDAELLTFVSYQIASSLQRRRSAQALLQLNAELEHRVDERTRELREQIVVREQVEARLKHQVMHDPLTGLPNRLYMRDRIERALAGLRRNPERRFALLYLDVDRFKLFNDSLGHLAGDEVLREVARRLGDCIREPDVAARLSGDEFAILLEEVPVPQVACKVARRIQEALQKPMQIAGRELQTSASIGIAVGDERYDSTDELFHDADVALYRAKSAGRQRFVLFDDTLQQAAMDVLEIEQGLRTALAGNQLQPYFQPLVRLADRHVVGYEALVRWHHPQRGLLLPGEFLQVAEDSGLMEAVDWQMYRMACEQGGPLVEHGGFLTLNISPRHFQNGDFDTQLLQLAADTGFNPAQLRIEVTEGTLLGDPEAVIQVLERLRAACVEAALDDFGTGYSSLGHVHQFPLKMIKIDRSFVDPLGRQESREGSQRSSAIISAILALARSLGLEVVAEGVETEAQYEALTAMGCSYAQGYLFGRPQPAARWLGPTG
ncbi:sensor domain-containing diguanylate cyclase [Novilysobacter spongiicola]|uniref:Diguanylate cyclase (GGDEF) domain-containing protein n=1 Tax=Lysobacter spongiicola DSM 21749 TaxID=1122188 RepID=A0A1T4MM01_9GAMM|nr:EAL domain-containing protein [Lysobacter spongiicola]SJZ67794.1 diguanylate cyclase (GGDEF) domain-containing protein [Lysobacter spongiicola DSM 21749]